MAPIKVINWVTNQPQVLGGLLISVIDLPYNANGDGIKDDFPAINAAINDISKAGGGTLYFPAGKYLCTSGSISPASNMVLQGAGIDVTIISNNVQTFPNDQTISIYGTMTGANTGWPDSNTTYPINAPTIGDSKVTTTAAADAGNFPADTIIFISGGLHSTSFWYPGWHTTVLSSNPATGIITLTETLPFGGSQITTVQKILSLKQNIAIRDMTLVSGKASALGCFVAKNILIENVKCIPGVAGVATGPGAALGVCRNSMFRNCRMEQGCSPIELFVASDSYIEGCHLTNSGIVIDGGCFDCGVINNYIKDPMQSGVGVSAVVIANYDFRCKVIGNSITGVSANTQGVNIPGAGVSIEGGHTIIGNSITTVDTSTTFGIGINNVSNNTVVGNYINNAAFGIGIAAGSIGNTVEANTIVGVTTPYFVDSTSSIREPFTAALWPALFPAGATPSVKNGHTFQVFQSGAQNTTNFTDGITGQEIAMFFGDSNTTLVAGPSLHLSGGINYNPPANTMMKFVFLQSGGFSAWYELSRVTTN